MPEPSLLLGEAMADAPPVKVLYIVGSGRSGSTILCQLLGEYDGFFCGGELSDFWDRYIGENRLCACGVEFRSCKIWSRIMGAGMPEMTPSEALNVAELHRRVGRTQQLPLLLFRPLRGFARHRLSKYMAHLGVLYRAIRAETDSRIVVDSSKFPSYGWILGRVPGIELFVVHLVRDPRAVAYSWTRRRPPSRAAERVATPRFGPISSSIRWLTRNILAEALWSGDPHHYILLRYEDFVADPQAAVARILELVDEQPSAGPFAGAHHVRLGENHIVLGNRTRFLRGMVDIRPDSEWQTRITLMARAIVEATTWPWMLRYRYTPHVFSPPIEIQPGESA